MAVQSAWSRILHSFIVQFSVAIFICAGCSTTLSVESEPAGAEVYLSQSPTARAGRAIGTTPLSVSLSEMSLERGGYLIVRLPGYLTETILISEPALGTTSAEMFVRLNAGTRDGEKASMLLSLLASAQEQARVGQTDMAHATIDRAIEMDGYFVRGLSFKGALYFIEKKYADSATYYKKAQAIDPNFAESTRMLTKIELAQKVGDP